ncbi:MAG TPA: GNAT family N-acetyltransferase [Longimicrobiales bacterium]|nr:GNAT family N-acetyltransferase [Longimicrobiales bacterium]
MPVRVVEGVDEIALLAEGTEGSPGAYAGLPTRLPFWLIHSLRYLHPDAATRSVFVTSDDGKLRGLAPLVETPGGRGPLELAGSAIHDEPSDVFWADDDALTELCEGVARLGVPVVLDRLPVGSPTVDRLRGSLGLRGRMFVRASNPTPWVEIDPEDPLGHMSSRRRQDLRRARRRAEALGGFSSEVAAPRPGEVDALLDLALDIEAASWKGAKGTAVAFDELRAPFYRAVARSAAEKGLLRIAIGRIGGDPCAMQVALHAGDSFWLLKIGYDEQFSRCSPGQLMMEDSIRWAADAGVLAYEFLGTVESWTAMWTSLERSYVRLLLFPWTFSGARALAEKVLKKVGRSATGAGS